MNKEQYKRIRNLVNKLKAQADSEGFTVAEFDLLLTKFLPTQGYALTDWKKAEKKWENKIEVDYSNTPSVFVGERGREGPRGRDSTIPGPRGPAIPGPRGKKGDRGPQGKAGTITTEDFKRLRERLYVDQLKPADLDKKLNERFDGINKKLTQFITTSVLEPSIKAIVTPELNRYLRSIQSTAYTALLEAKKAAGGTVTEVSVVTANGVSGTVATATTTPAITLTLGDITPSSVTVSGLTASELVATDASKVLQSLAVATYPSLTEVSYVKGVTGAIQTQFTGKAATDQTMFIGTTSVAINRASAALTLAGITLTTPDIGTPSAGTLTNCTGLPVAGIVASTVTALGVGSIELGHASDTSITRVSAGVIAVEGVNVVLSTVTSLGSLTTAAVLPWTGMKPGTDGEIPTFDASGNPAFVAVGTATHVLTSNGPSAPPTFQAPGGGAVTATTVSISSANILGMFATPVEVLAAPGAGKIRIIDEVVFSFTVGTQYANGGNVRLQYDGDTVNILNNTFATGNVTGASSVWEQMSSNFVSTTAAVSTNKAIKITNATAAFITGTGTLKLFILYRDITL